MISSAVALQQFAAEAPGILVAVVTETFPPEINDVAMTLGRLVGALQAHRYQVQLIRPRQHAHEMPVSMQAMEELLVAGVPIPGYQGLRIGLPAAAAINRLWAARRPDVVHIATEGLLGWSALRTAQKLGLPVVSGFHTNFHSYSCHYRAGFLNRPIMAYLRRFHNAGLATMVPTDGLRQDLARQGYRNLRVVARGVDTQLLDPLRRDQRLRSRWGVADADLAALYVGRLAPEKNLKLVVRAFEGIRSIDTRAKIVWVGDGPERTAMRRRFPQHVFAGARIGEDLAAHYASAYVFLFASMTETFGNVTLEAMASGLAVLAYDYAAAHQHVEHGVSGMLALFGDADAFVRLARSLAGDPALLARLRQDARAVAERAAWSKIFDDYRRILDEAIARPAARGREHRPPLFRAGRACVAKTAADAPNSTLTALSPCWRTPAACCKCDSDSAWLAQ